MKRLGVSLILMSGLTACGTFGPNASAIRSAEPAPGGGNPVTSTSEIRLGNGYRGSDDPCRRAGATDLTASMLREDADLVACPLDFEGRPAFQRTTGGREMGRTGDYVLYSVPLLGNTVLTPTPPPASPTDLNFTAPLPAAG